jgi:DNA-binding NtrC family response regulator
MSELPESRDSLRQRLEDYERHLIEEALRATGYHQRHAAAALGILPSTLCEKMKRLGIPSRQRILAALVASAGAARPEALGPLGDAGPIAG